MRFVLIFSEIWGKFELTFSKIVLFGKIDFAEKLRYFRVKFEWNLSEIWVNFELTLS